MYTTIFKHESTVESQRYVSSVRCMGMIQTKLFSERISGTQSRQSPLSNDVFNACEIQHSSRSVSSPPRPTQNLPQHAHTYHAQYSHDYYSAKHPPPFPPTISKHLPSTSINAYPPNPSQHHNPPYQPQYRHPNTRPICVDIGTGCCAPQQIL